MTITFEKRFFVSESEWTWFLTQCKIKNNSDLIDSVDIEVLPSDITVTEYL